MHAQRQCAAGLGFWVALCGGQSCLPSDVAELLDAGLPLQTGAEAVGQEACAQDRCRLYHCLRSRGATLVVFGGGQLVALLI